MREFEHPPADYLTPITQLKPHPIDIIMPTHNKHQSMLNSSLNLTMRCVDAIYQNTRTPFRLIIVDDSADKLTGIYLKELKRELSNVQVIHSNRPFKNGNEFFNIGFKNAASDYVVAMCNSVEVEPQWELAAVEFMGKEPLAGIVGFKSLFPWYQIESAGIELIGFIPADLGRNFHSHRSTIIYECLAVQWACALVRKQAAIGNLAEDVYHGFVGWDDIDNCLVIRNKGWKVFYCGYGVYKHYPRATRGKDDLETARKNIENAQAFYKRWGLWEAFKTINPQAVDIDNPKWFLIKDLKGEIKGIP